jgi:uroporphyrinogen-III synthase
MIARRLLLRIRSPVVTPTFRGISMNVLLSQPVLLGVCVFLLSAIAVKLFFKENKKLANQKRAAIALATDLSNRGLTLVPDFLNSFAVGDIGEMAEDLEKVVLLLENSTAMDKEFDNVFANMIKANPAQATAILASLATPAK